MLRPSLWSTGAPCAGGTPLTASTGAVAWRPRDPRPSRAAEDHSRPVPGSPRLPDGARTGPGPRARLDASAQIVLLPGEAHRRARRGTPLPHLGHRPDQQAMGGGVHGLLDADREVRQGAVEHGVALD